MCDPQLAGNSIFQHTGASLVTAQLNDSSFIAEDIWTIPVNIFIYLVCDYVRTYIIATYNLYVYICIHMFMVIMFVFFVIYVI